MKKTHLYGLNFTRTNEKNAAKYLSICAAKGYKKTVFTPNLQILCAASKDTQLLSLLKGADLLLPDGVGISLLYRKEYKQKLKRVTGIDTAYALLECAAKDGLSVFLLGGKPQTAELAGTKLQKKLPTLNICGTHHGYFDKQTESEENAEVISMIHKANPDILFVCFGFPLQEEWIIKNRDSLPCVKIFMGLGGSLDVWSGNVSRAPMIFRKCGLEWLWRCMREPKRFIKLFRDIRS